MARILVIDDEPDIRALLDEVLKSAGYEVILAANGREAVMRQRSSPADLLITDLYVPNLEGLEIIREFRSHFPEVVIIAMSGTTAALSMLPVAQQLGALGILHKPFLPGELIDVVEKALGSKITSPVRRGRRRRHGARPCQDRRARGSGMWGCSM